MSEARRGPAEALKRGWWWMLPLAAALLLMGAALLGLLASEKGVPFLYTAF